MALGKYPSYTTNPEVVKNIVRVKRTVHKKDNQFNVRLTSKTTGEILHEYDIADTIDPKFVKYDNEGFLKLYHKNLQAFARLNQSASRMFFYIASQLGKNEDWLIIDIAESMDYCCLTSKVTVYKALEELLMVRAIFRKTSDDRTLQFWINPNAFFNGDRVKYMEKKL